VPEGQQNNQSGATDLLAPRESVRKAFYLLKFTIATYLRNQSANKELKSGS
jgi:5-hydroxyisourate hydrolase-like protein (transthyretin family)